MMDTGKDADQKLTDVSYRSAAGPLQSPSGYGNNSCTSTHRTSHDIMGGGMFTQPLAPALL
jgi:hypothetical protein